MIQNDDDDDDDDISLTKDGPINRVSVLSLISLF